MFGVCVFAEDMTANQDQASSCTGSMPPLQSPCKQAPRKEVKWLRTKVYRLEEKCKSKKDTKSSKTPTVKHTKDFTMEKLSHFLPDECLAFGLAQVQQVAKKKRGQRWTEKDKTTAFSLFYASPKAYRLLEKIFFSPLYPHCEESSTQVFMIKLFRLWK